jgi:hypothetical protein
VISRFVAFIHAIDASKQSRGRNVLKVSWHKTPFKCLVISVFKLLLRAKSSARFSAADIRLN